MVLGNRDNPPPGQANFSHVSLKIQLTVYTRIANLPRLGK